MPDTVKEPLGFPRLPAERQRDKLLAVNAALAAALKGLLHAFLREAGEGDGVHEQDVPAVDAATAALTLAELGGGVGPAADATAALVAFAREMLSLLAALRDAEARRTAGRGWSVRQLDSLAESGLAALKLADA